MIIILKIGLQKKNINFATRCSTSLKKAKNQINTQINITNKLNNRSVKRPSQRQTNNKQSTQIIRNYSVPYKITLNHYDRIHALLAHVLLRKKHKKGDKL